MSNFLAELLVGMSAQLPGYVRNHIGDCVLCAQELHECCDRFSQRLVYIHATFNQRLRFTVSHLRFRGLAPAQVHYSPSTCRRRLTRCRGAYSKFSLEAAFPAYVCIDLGRHNTHMCAKNDDAGCPPPRVRGILASKTEREREIVAYYTHPWFTGKSYNNHNSIIPDRLEQRGL